MEIDRLALALGAIAGLSLFLYGVTILARALRELGGGRFEQVLRASTGNRVAALASGTAATVALDSSSVAIILLVALVDAAIVPLASALPIVLGANIGTTVSSQVFAWDVDRWSPLLLAAGLLGRALAGSDRARHAASMVLGIGLVLFGLHTLGVAAEPLADSPAAKAWLEQLDDPLVGVLAGAAGTIAIQSSSAMMGIVIVLAGGGLLSLEAGVAIMLGAEIGTCADTLLATIGRSRAAVKVGLFHLGFNIASVSVGLLLVGELAAFGAATASDTGQRIANAHVLFNIAGALAVLPFTGWLAAGLDGVLPDREAARAS